MSTFEWDLLDFWGSSDWLTIQERLDGYDKSGVCFNPDREQLFAALDSCSFDQTKVAILGQDPYPNGADATGIAFDIPDDRKSVPPSLSNILKEYCHDLGYPEPRNKSIKKWCAEGVLLWNVYPSCEAGRPGSHHWPEWETLTKEIVERLDQRERSCLFVFLGRVAGAFAENISQSDYIEVAHPSPLSAHRGFLGSRIFSTINCKLSPYRKYVDWRLE